MTEQCFSQLGSLFPSEVPVTLCINSIDVDSMYNPPIDMFEMNNTLMVNSNIAVASSIQQNKLISSIQHNKLMNEQGGNVPHKSTSPYQKIPLPTGFSDNYGGHTNHFCSDDYLDDDFSTLDADQMSVYSPSYIKQRITTGPALIHVPPLSKMLYGRGVLRDHFNLVEVPHLQSLIRSGHQEYNIRRSNAADRLTDVDDQGCSSGMYSGHQRFIPDDYYSTSDTTNDTLVLGPNNQEFQDQPIKISSSCSLESEAISLSSNILYPQVISNIDAFPPYTTEGMGAPASKCNMEIVDDDVVFEIDMSDVPVFHLNPIPVASSTHEDYPQSTIQDFDEECGVRSGGYFSQPCGVHKSTYIEVVSFCYLTCGLGSKKNAFDSATSFLNSHPAEKLESLRPFCSKYTPNILVDDYVFLLWRTIQAPEIFVLAFVLLSRVPLSFVSSFTIHRFILVTVVIACKIIYGDSFTNEVFAEEGGVRVSQLNALERNFLQISNFEVIVTPQEYEAGRRCLLVMATFGLVTALDVPDASYVYVSPEATKTFMQCFTHKSILSKEKRLTKKKRYKLIKKLMSYKCATCLPTEMIDRMFCRIFDEVPDSKIIKDCWSPCSVLDNRFNENVQYEREVFDAKNHGTTGSSHQEVTRASSEISKDYDMKVEPTSTLKFPTCRIPVPFNVRKETAIVEKLNVRPIDVGPVIGNWSFAKEVLLEFQADVISGCIGGCPGGSLCHGILDIRRRSVDLLLNFQRSLLV